MIQLFDNDADLRGYLPLKASFALEYLEADIDSALRKYILPYCSREQFDVSKDIAVGAANFAKHDELMSLIKKGSAYLAMYLYLPEATVSIDGDSISYSIDKDMQASAQDKLQLSQSLQRKGLESVDEILTFLEANIDVFTEWADSDSCTEYKDRIIRSVAEFKIINNSRSVFLRLVPFMEDEEFELEQSIQASIWTKLKSREWPEASADKAKWITLLTSYVQPVLRNRSLASAMNSLAVVLDQFDTLTVFDNTGSNMSKAYIHANQEKIDRMKGDLVEKADKRSQLMMAYIQENAAVFGYEAPEVENAQEFINQTTHNTKFFGGFN